MAAASGGKLRRSAAGLARAVRTFCGGGSRRAAAEEKKGPVRAEHLAERLREQKREEKQQEVSGAGP